MNLKELQQVKQDLANGIIISRSQWVKVLDAAIKMAERGDDKDRFFTVPADTILNFPSKEAWAAHMQQQQIKGELEQLGHKFEEKK